MCNLCGRAASEQAAVMAALRAQPPSASSVSLTAVCRWLTDPTPASHFIFPGCPNKGFVKRRLVGARAACPHPAGVVFEAWMFSKTREEGALHLWLTPNVRAVVLLRCHTAALPCATTKLQGLVTAGSALIATMAHTEASASTRVSGRALISGVSSTTWEEAQKALSQGS